MFETVPILDTEQKRKGKLQHGASLTSGLRQRRLAEPSTRAGG